jgi:hypothetical protein
MADGDDLYFRVTGEVFFPLLPHLHFEVKICNPTNKISVALVFFSGMQCEISFNLLVRITVVWCY